jgi:hypothetical protein
MLHAQLFPAVWNEDLTRWRPVEKTDNATKDRITKFMYWVVRVQMKMRNFADDAVKYCIKVGTMVLKDRWDVKLKDLDEQEPMTTTDDMGNTIAIMGEDGQPLMRGVLHREEKAASDLVPIERFYTQPGQTDIQDEPIIHRVDYYYSDLEKFEMMGKMRNITDNLKPQVDSMIVTEVDRALAEAEKIAIVDVKRRVYPCDVLEWYGPYDANEDGFAEEIMAMVEKKTKTLVSAIKLSKISKRGNRPFVLRALIRREHKLLGIGMLEAVEPLAREIDAIFQQLTDGNTLSIMRWGFYDPGSDYDPETHKIKPRAMYPVADPQKAVYFPDIAIPTERLLAAIRLVLEFIERLTAASSYVMGKESEIVGGSGTATRTQAIVGAAEQRFDIPAQRIRDGFAEHLTNQLCQYQLNIPPGLESRVLGEDGQPLFEEGSLIRENLSAELDCYIDGDPAMGNKNTEREIASFLYNTLMSNPLVATDPVKLYKVTADLIRPLGKEPSDYLGPEPNMKDFDSPEDENTLMLEGRLRDVRPVLMENHLEHIQIHSMLSTSVAFGEISKRAPELGQLVLQYNQQHIEQHKAMMAQMAQVMAMVSKTKKPSEPAHKTSGMNQGQTPSSLENIPGEAKATAPNQMQGTAL